MNDHEYDRHQNRDFKPKFGVPHGHNKYHLGYSCAISDFAVQGSSYALSFGVPLRPRDFLWQSVVTSPLHQKSCLVYLVVVGSSQLVGVFQIMAYSCLFTLHRISYMILNDKWYGKANSHNQLPRWKPSMVLGLESTNVFRGCPQL